MPEISGSKAGYLTEDEQTAVIDAVMREISGVPWDEVKYKSLADVCYVNQDALIDDICEKHPDDMPHLGGMRARVRLYDVLLSTDRARVIKNA